MLDRYRLKETWNEYDSDMQIKAKADLFRQLIPEDVTTVIDVGCGNGIITNELALEWDVIGLDSSEEALKYLKCPAILASATDIPYNDQKFDLVICSEMLEHLNNSDLNIAISEIIRVSGKYLLISVPNDEFLEVSYTECPKCKTVFHAWHHLQSISEERLYNFFSKEYFLLKTTTFGPKHKKWIPGLLKLRQYLGQWFYPGNDTICPECGNNRFPKSKKNALTKLINGLNLFLSRSKPYWQIQLLQKK